MAADASWSMSRPVTEEPWRWTEPTPVVSVLDTDARSRMTCVIERFTSTGRVACGKASHSAAVPAEGEASIAARYEESARA